jgi:hypothetical protein
MATATTKRRKKGELQNAKCKLQNGRANPQSPIPNPPQKPRANRFGVYTSGIEELMVVDTRTVTASISLVCDPDRGKTRWRAGHDLRHPVGGSSSPVGITGKPYETREIALAAMLSRLRGLLEKVRDREGCYKSHKAACVEALKSLRKYEIRSSKSETSTKAQSTKARKSEGPKMPVCAEDCSDCDNAATCPTEGRYPPTLVHAKAQGRKAAKSASSASSAVPSPPRLPEAKADPIGGNGEASGSDAAKWIHENVCPKGRTERRSTNGSAADVRSPGGTGKKAGDGHQGEIRNPKSETRNKSEIQNPKSKIAGTALVPATPANLPLGDGPALSPSERKDLARLETLIDRGVRASFAAGIALKEIQERKLYREHFATFEDYCREKLGSSRSDAYRQIQAATLHEVAEKVIEKNSLVVTESHFRPLSKLDDDQVRAVFAAVAKRVKPGADGRRRPTMELVAETAREYATPPEEKHEARNPKSETNPKSEIQNPKSADLSGPANSDGEGRAGGQDEELGGRREEEEKTTAPPVPSRKQARQVVTRSFGGEARRKFWYELNGIEAAVIACANEFAHSIWRDEMRAMLRDLLAQFDAASDYVP